MLRRDFVRALVSAVLSSRLLRAQQAANPAPSLPAPVPWTLGLNPRTPLPHTEVAEGIAQAGARFFTSRQMATLTRLSEVLFPAMNGKPGALDAETPQFLDFLVGKSPEPRKRMYIAGLDWLDAESVRVHKLPFARIDATQAGALLQPLLRSWMSDHPPTEPHAEFINVAHTEIRSATVNSKAWNEQLAKDSEESTAVALYWSPIDPAQHGIASGCAPIPHGAFGAPKAGHAIPVIPR
jgi:hypothetical protein